MSSSSTENDEAWFAAKVQSCNAAVLKLKRVHVIRLVPGEDLLESLFRFARLTRLEAASIVTAVGSLSKTCIRYAANAHGTERCEPVEIVSLVGNIDCQNENDFEGSGHVHISCSDKYGQMFGGHLLLGNIVRTTVELTVLEMADGKFIREFDDGPNGSGYIELKIVDST